MKKIILADAAIGCLLATGTLAHEEQNFDPKAGKHLVIPMEQLSEKGNMSVGEVVAIEISSIQPVQEMAKLMDTQTALFSDIPSLWPIKNNIGHITIAFGQNRHPFTGQ